MTNDNVLTKKEEALISLAASIGSGCRPCTAYHIKSARGVGACERSVSLAVETALAGRGRATRGMDEWAGRYQKPRPDADAAFRSAKLLLMELMSVATAVAVNSVPDLERHLAAARDNGTEPKKILAAISIARQIKRVAEEKIEAVTSRLEERVRPNETEAAAAACCGSSQTGSVHPVAGAIRSCGCR